MHGNKDQVTQWQSIAKPGEGGAVCFDLQAEHRMHNGQIIEASEQGFVVCFEGKLRAWRNNCPHAGSPLDWIPGQFFSDDGKQLICHTHGASFDPLSGDCRSGPCDHGLYPLPMREHVDGVEVPFRIAAPSPS